MADTITADSPLVAFLKKARPSSIPSAASASNDYTIGELIKLSFPSETYTEPEKTEINQWIVASKHIGSPNEDVAKTDERFSSLNRHLSTRTTLLGNKLSLADLAIYSRMAPIVAKWTPDERTGEHGFHHIVRHTDFVQNSSDFDLSIPDADKVKIDLDEVRVPIKPVDVRAEKERKKREKDALAAATNGVAALDTSDNAKEPTGRKAKKEAKAQQKSTVETVAAAVAAVTPGVAQPSAGTDNPSKKEKKEKPKKAPAAPPAEKPLSPALIDLRVGHILKAEQHPNADSLYVSTIAVGDAPGTDNTSEYEGQVVRTVCSGLNGLVPLEEMQGRKIIAVCNLKPVTMRGIKSAAMVLAASPRLKEGEVDDHKGPVELVEPPAGAIAGDRVLFEGWEGEPEGQLNPKKKIWESCQIGFTTTPSCEVAFDAAAVEQLKGEGKPEGLLKTKGGVCTVKSLKGATVR